MNSEESTERSPKIKTPQIFHISLQLLALGILIYWSFNILVPFANPILWGAILAVVLYPLHQGLKQKLGGKNVLASIIISGFFLVILIAAGSWLVVKTGSEIKSEIEDYQAGRIHIPPPPETVKSWPVIGKASYRIWQEMSSGLEQFIQNHPEEVRNVTAAGIGLLATTGKGLLIFLFAIIICGAFLAFSEESASFAKRFFNRLVKSKNFDMAAISAITVRNVVKGVLGVAIIQSVCAGVGFVVAGVPYAGIWILLCLILAIIQVGILPVTIGVLIYAWSSESTTTALLLTIWMIPVGLLDNFLKPLMMGKGAPVPMLVIFLGALGGFMYSGFVGLFTGAVVLSLGYRLFEVWLKDVEL